MDDAEADHVREIVGKALRALCPHWLTGEIEDLAQAVTLKVLEGAARSGRGDERLAASYLWRAAHSGIVDLIRARVRHPAESLETGTRSIDPPGPGPGADDGLLAGELRSAIRDCLARIVTPRRRAVSLHLLGHTVPDIARLAGWDTKRADNLVYRGLGDLRSCLEAKGYGYAR